MTSAPENKLFYGDNLDVLRQNIKAESIDLVYLDPPFNSNRNYSVLFKEQSGDESQAQLEAFDDTWTWSQDADALYADLLNGPGTPNKVKDALEAMRRLLGDNDVLAYLVMMTARLLELRRVLKPTGSLYLHCDPTASHYLKVMLDAIFGPLAFRSEIIWKRTTAHNSAHRYGPVHDVILFYVRDPKTSTWNQQYQKYSPEYLASKYRHVDSTTGQKYRLSDMTGAGTRQGDSGKPWKGVDPTSIGRHWQPPSYCYWKYTELTGKDLAEWPLIERLDELERIGLVHWPAKKGSRPEHKRYLVDMPGVALQDVWTDIDAINARAAERLGYDTQKPLTLLERILSASSNPGEIVLDPFCGCGTTVDAAQRLGRRWIGIDITTLAVDLIDARLRHTYGEEIRDTYEILGIPRDRAGAAALFKRSPFEFERWCVMTAEGQPNEKQVGDRGIDGVIRFALDNRGAASDRALISVKGGATNPGDVRDLVGTVESQRAAMGIFITMNAPTKGMIEAANHSGTYVYPITATHYPKVQIITVRELLDGKRPKMPQTMLPYFQAQRRFEDAAEKLF